MLESAFKSPEQLWLAVPVTQHWSSF